MAPPTRTHATLPKTTYRWALKHLSTEGDTDLFPPPFELEALLSERSALVDLLAELDVTNHTWSQGRRFLVPTGHLSFRSATQLDPLDAIVFAALIRQYGSLIERARIPGRDRTVFSYRFSPTNDGRFYGPDSGWQDLWTAAYDAASKDDCRYVAILDVVDYYNQIYHHTIENELIVKSVPKPAVKAILGLLGTLTHGASRGIPVGPHAAHLLAECAMDPVDRSLSARNYSFCRYVDDIFIFCTSKDAAEIAVFECADILDRHQRLALQKKKVEILASGDFKERATRMMVNQPMNAEEEALLEIVNRHAGGSPYRNVSLADLTDEELKKVRTTDLERLFELYLSSTPINYARLAWLLRRLSQIAAPGGILYVLENIARLTPVLGDVGRYVVRAAMANEDTALRTAGEAVLTSLELPLLAHSEYMQMVLLNLFARVPALDHTSRLTARYQTAGAAARREIVS